MSDDGGIGQLRSSAPTAPTYRVWIVGSQAAAGGRVIIVLTQRGLITSECNCPTQCTVAPIGDSVSTRRCCVPPRVRAAFRGARGLTRRRWEE